MLRGKNLGWMGLSCWMEAGPVRMTCSGDDFFVSLHAGKSNYLQITMNVSLQSMELRRPQTSLATSSKPSAHGFWIIPCHPAAGAPDNRAFAKPQQPPHCTHRPWCKIKSLGTAQSHHAQCPTPPTWRHLHHNSPPLAPKTAHDRLTA